MPSIQWKKGNNDLVSSPKYVMSSFNKRLTIKNLNREDTGVYQCVITRAALSTDFPQATLTVIGKKVNIVYSSEEFLYYVLCGLVFT